MTTQFDVYGIGNGIVDNQIKVTDVELEELALEKGGMSLAEPADQQRILDQLHGRDGVSNAGGSAANTIVGLAQMGATTAYTCATGNDDFGTFYTNDLEDVGVKTIAATKHDQPSGTCLVLITPDGERTMSTHLAASSALAVADIDTAIIEASRWVYIEGYLLTGSETASAAFAAAEAAKSCGAKVAFTFSDGFVVDVFGDDVRRMTREFADLIFANEREAAAYSDKRDPQESLNMILKDCPAACVTCSAEGSYIHLDGSTDHVAAYPATPIDLTGAGDMYAAGVLYGMVNQWPQQNSARLGSRAAHKVVVQLGARLPGKLTDSVAEFV